MASQNYSLAYMQVQLALVSLIILGIYAVVKDAKLIMEKVKKEEWVLSYVCVCVCVVVG